MKSYAILALAAAAKLANAHATVYAAWINDVDQGLGNSQSGYIRTPPSNSPITDVTSSQMTCNANNVAADKTLEVKAGDKITFEWHHNDRSSGDDIIASSHYGPVMTYIAPTESNGEGDVWVKLAEDGYTGTYPNGKWAVTTLIENKGKHSITIPTGLKEGSYLLRPEIIALHEGNRAGGAQFYMECVQVKVTSSGSVSLPAGVAIPGAYTATDAGVLFDIYNSFTSYPIPGPAVWDGASSGSDSGSTPSKAASSSAAPAVTSAPAAVSSAPAAAVTSAPAAESSAVAPVSSVVTPTTLVTLTRTAASAPSKTPVYYDCGGKIEVHYE